MDWKNHHLDRYLILLEGVLLVGDHPACSIEIYNIYFIHNQQQKLETQPKGNAEMYYNSKPIIKRANVLT